MRREVSPKVALVTIASLLAMLGLIAYFTFRPSNGSQAVPDANSVQAQAELMQQLTQDPASQIQGDKANGVLSTQSLSSMPAATGTP